jgi:DNA polymerase-3 subunit delta
MPSFKSAYLVFGDDHGRIAERRARLRALAEAESGAGGVEVFEGEAATPETVSMALSAMTIALGRRFVIVDGVERWRDADVEAELAPVLASLPPQTTVAFFAREEGRLKAPAQLHAAVKAAGGDVSPEATLKEWELPRWVGDHAQSLGLELDTAAARALVAQVGERRQRLARELEKIAIECGPGARLDAAALAERAAGSAERRAWSLADALVAGDRAAATRLYLRLRSQGERVESLSYWMVRRLREALGVALALEGGSSEAQIKRSLRMPAKAAERFIADVRRSDPTRLRQALVRFADLELDSRGGAELDADTLALRAIAATCA